MSHYRLIDSLRFVAALAVAILHWNIFVFEKDWGDYALAFEDTPPLPVLLGPIYDFGYYAVQFFWMLSGFIFAFVYGNTQIDLRTFAVRRFARLYPLAILSLAIVAYFQGVFLLREGAAYFYPENDLYHYILNLLLISAWGAEEGLSFNGPFWSVSAEIPIYFLFWGMVRVLPMNAVTCLVTAAVFFKLQDVMTFTHIDYCGMMFFLGSATYYICKQITPRMLIGVGLAAWGGGLAAILVVPALQQISTLMLVLAFGPLLVLTSALDRIWAGRGGWLIDRMRSAGDVSYAIYLLHFPIILAITLTMTSLGIDRSILSGSLLALLAFLGVTIWVSYVSFTWFERPARVWLCGALGDTRAMKGRSPASAALN